MAESKKVTATLARTKQVKPADLAATSSDELTPKRKHDPLSLLLANYWDKPLSELPEELRARVSLQKEKRIVGLRPKHDASGKLECDAEVHYPVWEKIYAEHETGDWIIDWDALTPKQRQMMASQIDDRHDPALINERWVGLIHGYYSIKGEWLHWAGKPTLVADEAIPLMDGLDPGSWRNRDRRTLPEQPLPDDMVSAITRGLQIAEADGSKAKNPAEWLTWGRSHGLDKPIMKSDQRLREPDICMWQLFAQAVAEVERKAQKKAEYRRRLSQDCIALSQSPLNLDYWLLHDKWTQEEGLTLLLGLDPRETKISPSIFFNNTHPKGLEEFEFAKFFNGKYIDSTLDDIAQADKRLMLQLSKRYQDIKKIWVSGNFSALNTHEFFVEWAISKGFNIPPELAALAKEASQAEAANKAQEEMVRKAHVSDWDHWASLPHLTPREAACLLMELDPENESDYFKCCNDPRCAALAEWINKIDRVAGRENEGKKLSPAEWIEWAPGKGYVVPKKFIEAVAEIERKENAKAERTTQEEAQKNDYFTKYGANPSDRIYPVWQKRMNEIAEDVKSKSRLKRYPTKGQAAKILAKELVASELKAPNIISSIESQKKIEKMKANIERHTQIEWEKKHFA